MAHAHHGPERRVRTSRKLLVSTVATLAFFGLELWAGLSANALSLISDAFHNITDAVALILAFIAVKLERRPPTAKRSYGYQRAGILAAFVNAAILIVLTVGVVLEAVRRFRAPEAVGSTLMIVVAAIGLVYNLGVTLWLRQEGKKDINVRSAVLHMMGDAIASAGVIVAAVMIRVTGDTVWDGVVSLFIGALILWSSLGILRETINLLLEGTPHGIDPDRISRDIAAADGVHDVHHLHIWAIGPSAPALSCHLLVGDVSVRRGGEILRNVSSILETHHRIRHTTIQLEAASCPEDDPTCVPPVYAVPTDRPH
ncbi:MAG TPA: cation diffusion facilitator family transporter [Thermoanaerobaculia bacterium]|nr:cation diffusion facilitator family transporter [Thermoanaerobaculia bacterium]